MTTQTRPAEQIVLSLITLRDDLLKRSFDLTGRPTSPLAEAVYKINSVLYTGYPTKSQESANV